MTNISLMCEGCIYSMHEISSLTIGKPNKQIGQYILV